VYNYYIRAAWLAQYLLCVCVYVCVSIGESCLVFSAALLRPVFISIDSHRRMTFFVVIIVVFVVVVVVVVVFLEAVPATLYTVC